MFCTQCGVKSVENAKFCAGCGAVLTPSLVDTPHDDTRAPVESVFETPAPLPSPPAQVEDAPFVSRASLNIEQRLETEPSPYAEQGDQEIETPWWKKPLPLIAGGILILGFLLYGFRDFWLGMDVQPAVSNTTASSSGADGNSVQPIGNAFYAVRKAKLRDKPTTDGSIVKGEVTRGTQLTGVLVEGSDGKSQWLKIDTSGYFISAANISNEAPVALSSALNRPMTLDEQSDVRSRPSDDAAPVDSLVSGTVVDAVGIANGWVEITLKKGGVGYIKPSEKSTNFGLLSGQAPVKTAAATLDFDKQLKLDPSNCTFGGPIEGLFATMGGNADKAPFSVIGLPGLFKSTKASPEATTIVTPVAGRYHGVSVTGVFEDGEGQGLYFGDSVEAVGSALSDLGFTKDDKGNYATSDEGVGAYISSVGGKTQLYCGS
jgi:hypothetical protein